MSTKHILYSALLLAIGFGFAGCSEEGPDANGLKPGSGIVSDDFTLPSFSQGLVEWHGERADDAAKDVVGTDKDLYHELSSFPHTVTVSYHGDNASVTTTNTNILTNVNGAYVTVDFQSRSVSGVHIVVEGQSSDGALKIYGDSKFHLTLNGVELASKRGPALNNQCKKRVFLTLADNSTNFLADSKDYTADSYYRPGSDETVEDRKGCFFSEGDMIVNGTGSLEVKGRERHAIAGDGYLVVRPGATLAVTESARNAYHFKGDLKDDIGVRIMGGYIYAMTTSAAGKAIKTDQNIRIEGGTIVLNTAGDATYDDETDDTSSAACLKADNYVLITAGSLALRSTGRGAKGINASTYVNITGGEIGVSCSGERYVYSETLSASSKAVKAAETIRVSAGSLIALSTGHSDGSRALESDEKIEICGDAALELFSYDDAINAPDVSFTQKCRIKACSIHDDGVRAKGTLSISGADLMAIGGTTPGAGINCISSTGEVNFSISEESKVIAIGGAASTKPTAVATNWRVWDELTVKASDEITVSCMGNELMSFTIPCTVTNGAIMIIDKRIPANEPVGLLADGRLCVDNVK